MSRTVWLSESIDRKIYSFYEPTYRIPIPPPCLTKELVFVIASIMSSSLQVQIPIFA